MPAGSCGLEGLIIPLPVRGTARSPPVYSGGVARRLWLACGPQFRHRHVIAALQRGSPGRMRSRRLGLGPCGRTWKGRTGFRFRVLSPCTTERAAQRDSLRCLALGIRRASAGREMRCSVEASPSCDGRLERLTGGAWGGSAMQVAWCRFGGVAWSRCAIGLSHVAALRCLPIHWPFLPALVMVNAWTAAVQRA